jgi:GNAT superfamily N-acetyltransferase
MQHNNLSYRLARREDVAALSLLMAAAISENQKPFLTSGQIASSRTIMGLDTQLIDDGTYFVIEFDNELAGCGGWSCRATLYGSNNTPGRDAALLDPARDPARIRAMYTHPDYTRRGVGRLIMALCEDAARLKGFRRIELMATLSGQPLYVACGYQAIEHIEDNRGGEPVPLIRMGKTL